MTQNVNPMVNLFSALGHRIYNCGGAFWYDVQPGVLLTIPYYKTVRPDENKVRELVKKEGLKAVRYPTPLDSFGFVSNITINTNTGCYNMSCLHQKARNQTRRGLENCTIERIDFDYLAEHGLELNISTAQRQGRESYYCDKDYWTKYCNAAQKVEGVDGWGAFIDGRLVCFLVAVEAEDKWSEWIVNHTLTEYRNKYPNNALAFTAGQYYLNENKFKGICYGLGSLEETQPLDHFKSRMGWRVEPIKQRLIFSDKIKFAFALANEPCLKLINKMFPKNYFIRKTSAMIRLYKQQTDAVPTLKNDD